jgi:hypothetical protein
MSLAIAHPHATYVRWGCRRCGHRGGMARTTVPFDFSQTQRDGSRDVMFKELIRALIRKHWQRQHCVAIESDFIVEPCNPHGDRT